MRIAAIDVGTNTIRLLVVDPGQARGYRPVFATQEMTRLGQGLRADRQLQPEPVRRSLEAVRRFAGLARRHGAERVVAIGTSALRDARNAEALLAPAGRLGLEFRIISGEEEAALTLLGVRASLPQLPAHLLMLDIGGGSTEFLLAEGARIRAAVSTGLGSVRLTEAYLASDPPPPEELGRLRTAVDARLHALGPAELPACAPDSVLVGTAGTITTLAVIDLGLAHYDPDRVNGHLLSRARISSLLEELASLPLARRQAVPGLEPGRADIILAGAIVCLSAMEYFGFGELRVSEGGLREGILLDLLSGGPDERIGNLDKGGAI
jgi:exopolyphosphatase/guanosine-5'-triphosphate,3'-diphosphate pyrophosphatase